MNEIEIAEVETLFEQNAFSRMAALLSNFAEAQDVDALSFLGLLYRSRGFSNYSLATAEQYYRKAFEIDPEEGRHGLRQIGKLFFLDKQFKSAAELLEETFEATDVEVANLLGFCFSRKGSGCFDLLKAKRYYEISADLGDAHGQYGLAWLHKTNGNDSEALKLFLESSKKGSGPASYNAYLHFLSVGNLTSAREFLALSANQGHAVGVQKYAMRRALGHYGAKSIVPGMLSYLHNIPNLYRFFSKNHVEASSFK